MPLPTPGKKEGARPGRPQKDRRTDKPALQFTSQLSSWQVQQNSHGRQFLPPDLLLILRRLSSTVQQGRPLVFMSATTWGDADPPRKEKSPDAHEAIRAKAASSERAPLPYCTLTPRSVATPRRRGVDGYADFIVNAGVQVAPAEVPPAPTPKASSLPEQPTTHPFNVVLTFGKYKHLEHNELRDVDTGYLRWGVEKFANDPSRHWRDLAREMQYVLRWREANWGLRV
jgi:hypothetical protein